MRPTESLLRGSLAHLVRHGSISELQQRLPSGGEPMACEDTPQLFCLAAERDDEDATKICLLLLNRTRLDPNHSHYALRQSPLFFAARSGTPELVDFFLAKLADVNQRDLNLQTPLFYAADQGRCDNVRTLLDAAANLQLTDSKGQTPLFKAAAKGWVDCVEALLGQRPLAEDVSSHLDSYGKTALFYTECPRCCQLLLDRRCRVDHNDGEGQTSLLQAARWGHEQLASLLLRARAQVNRSVEPTSQNTPLALAARAGHTAVVRLLLEAAADPRCSNAWKGSPAGLPPLSRAIGAELASLVAGAAASASLGNDVCPSAGTRPLSGAAGGSPLFASAVATSSARQPLQGFEATGAAATAALSDATERGSAKECHSLIESRADLSSGFLFPASACPSATRDVCRLLVDNGGLNPTCTDQNGRTALFSCVRQGHADAAAFLICARCDPDHADRLRQTPLFEAAARGHLDCAKTLLDATAAVDPKDHLGRTPLFLAAAQGHMHMLEALLKRGANTLTLDAGGLGCIFTAAPEAIGFLVSARCDLHAAGPEGRPPAVQAAATGEQDRLAALLAAGAQVNSAGLSGETALHAATTSRQGSVLLELLERHGADPSCKDATGRTAADLALSAGWSQGSAILTRRRADSGPESLDEAVEAGNAEACRRLVQQGCQVNTTNGNELQPTALFLAACRGHCAVLSTLLELRADTRHQNQHNRTAIFSAVQSGHSQCVSLLLQSQADVSHFDHHGQTPLFFAARLSSEESVRLLLAARAAASILNRSKRSPLFYAVKDTRVAAAKLLLDAEDLRAYQSAELADMAQQRGIHELADRLRPVKHVEEKAQPEAEVDQRTRRQEYRLCFEGEHGRSRKRRSVTYGSAEYKERLQQLQEDCPSLRGVKWPSKDG
eukprot:TRINITY_DN13955_c0_g2_i1.p1 TRINITY_DN13955_c0_g2~~TRINITY_DN13955_c0_g2_i1.p1  ORF type:complete len:897 (+),score=168.26 TRINITY_DN13955_c0_g2_i1:194-2884(+)